MQMSTCSGSTTTQIQRALHCVQRTRTIDPETTTRFATRNAGMRACWRICRNISTAIPKGTFLLPFTRWEITVRLTSSATRRPSKNTSRHAKTTISAVVPVKRSVTPTTTRFSIPIISSERSSSFSRKMILALRPRCFMSAITENHSARTVCICMAFRAPLPPRLRPTSRPSCGSAATTTMSTNPNYAERQPSISLTTMCCTPSWD